MSSKRTLRVAASEPDAVLRRVFPTSATTATTPLGRYGSLFS